MLNFASSIFKTHICKCAFQVHLQSLMELSNVLDEVFSLLNCLLNRCLKMPVEGVIKLESCIPVQSIADTI